MRKPLASASASHLILDTCREIGPDPRVWNLVSSRDISGNTIYGVTYSEWAGIFWCSSYENALRLFEDCQMCVVHCS